MELTYEITLEDMKAHARERVPLPPVGRRLLVQTWALILGGVAVVVAVWLVNTPLVAMAISAITVFCVPLAVLGAHARAMESGTDRVFAERAAGGPTSVIISLTLQQEGLLARSNRGESLTYWPSITALVQTGKFVTIRCGIEGQFTIPKRAFRDEQHMRAFLDEVARLRAAAQAQSQV